MTGNLIPAEVADFEFMASEMPVWRKLWSVTDHDNSRMIGSLSNNGGAYGERKTRTYYAAKMPCGEWKFRVITRNYSTAEFFQDDYGRYQRPEECTTYYITNAEGEPTVTLWGVRYDEDGERINEGNAVLEQHSEEVTLDQALLDSETNISSPYTWDGRLEYESETVTEKLPYSELKARFQRLEELGCKRTRHAVPRRRRVRPGGRRR